MALANRHSGDTPASGTRTIFFIGGAIVLLIALYFLAQFSRSVTVNRSATGFDGLPLWLSANEIDARTFYGRSALDATSIGLRILPLFDVDLGRTMGDTNDDEAAMAETDRDIRRYVVADKIEAMPTLVVMPKWRAGVRTANALHPKLLIADDSADTLTSQIGNGIGRLVRDPETTKSIGVTSSGIEYELHYPQTLTDSTCEALIGTSDNILLGRCEVYDYPFWVLADPDLLNNHGLSQGRNAEAALDWLPQLVDNGGELVLDLSTRIWNNEPGESSQPKRSWSDLSRFFDYPFSVIWLSLAVLGALTFWRAWRRYGAADDHSDEESGPRASRLVSMDTKARLLRLSGRDAEIVDTYVEGRLEALADDILGQHRARGSAGLDQLDAAISRRVPNLAKAFAELRNADLHTGTAPETLLSHVSRLDDLIERILDEFGRTGHAGR